MIAIWVEAYSHMLDLMPVSVQLPTRTFAPGNDFVQARWLESQWALVLATVAWRLLGF
jgi:hypothetical protein